MTPRAVVSSVDEPPGRSDLGGRRTPRLQVRATKPPAEAGRGRRSESPQVKPTILTLPRPWCSSTPPPPPGAASTGTDCPRPAREPPAAARVPPRGCSWLPPPDLHGLRIEHPHPRPGAMHGDGDQQAHDRAAPAQRQPLPHRPHIGGADQP